MESAHRYVSITFSHSLPPLPLNFHQRDGEMAERSQALAALADHQDFIPIAHL